jgi:hypothetical protein
MNSNQLLVVQDYRSSLHFSIDPHVVLTYIELGDWDYIFDKCTEFGWRDIGDFTDRSTCEFLNEL